MSLTQERHLAEVERRRADLDEHLRRLRLRLGYLREAQALGRVWVVDECSHLA
jgi:hypothetical protein